MYTVYLFVDTSYLQIVSQETPLKVTIIEYANIYAKILMKCTQTVLYVYFLQS